jgi:AcrR family transcriptional regulator
VTGPQRPDESPQSCKAPLRADAERNRQRIVEAAREVFTEQGVSASMNEVARRAGVGLATLLRRFPHRDQLVAATFEDRMAKYNALADQALKDPDPWHGFCEYIRAICAMQAADRGFADLMTQSFPLARQMESERAENSARVIELFDRAKRTGKLRRDFSPEDVPLIMMANAGVVSAAADQAPEASPRLIAYLLQAFSADHTAPLPPAPSPRQIYRVMLRFHRPRPTQKR